MGSPESEWGRGRDVEHQRPVTITRPFLMQQYEVTQAQWTDRGLPNPSGRLYDGSGDCEESECPVGKVSWMETLAFANLLSEEHDPPLEPCYVLSGCTGRLGNELTCESAELTADTIYECKGFRLPSGAEWEYAARAGTTDAFYSGPVTPGDVEGECYPEAVFEPIGWYCNNSDGETHPVGQLRPNAWGLYDMLGNSSEWVHDHHTGTSSRDPEVDPAGLLLQKEIRMVPGGMYNLAAVRCRAASQGMMATRNNRGPGVGFRLARTRPSG